MNFKSELSTRTEYADQVVKSYLPKEGSKFGNLVEALNYSVTAGGKRIRPVLLWEAYKMFGGKEKEAEPFMAAMEYIHTASLIHDDLPAIDNDEYRRGKKTTHAAFGEALGILAGDALLNYAYEVLAEGVAKAQSTKNGARAFRILAEKSGYRGMLGGQGVDVQNEKGLLKGDSREMLDYIYRKKTAALIEAALMAGAALAGASDEELAMIEQTGTCMGLAFQIKDDILDVTSTTEELGKAVFSDDKNEKATYVTLMGVEKAQEEVDKLSKTAADNLEKLPGDSAFLQEFIIYLADRKN